MLPAPSLLQWYADRNKIDMNPSYQRRSKLWSEKNQQLLINSVLNEFDVPKIYMADFTYINTNLQENRRAYAVIDGKQRLETFFSFFDNELRLDQTPVNYSGAEMSLRKQTYSELKENYPELAQKFDNFQLTVMSVITDDYLKIQEMFIRLNLNVSISGAERRNAMPGPLPHMIRELSVHEFFRANATFPVSRGQDLNLAAKLLLMENKNGFAATKKINLDQFVLENVKKKPAEFNKEFNGVRSELNKMTRIFKKQDDLLGSQARVPIYYQFVKKFGGQYSNKIRPFIEQIEYQRAQTRKQVSLRSKGIDIKISDPELMEFNANLRSHDDKLKQEAMFALLESRFTKYVKK